MSSIQHLACPLGGVAAVQDSCGWSCMTTSSGNCWKHCGRDLKAKLVNAKLPHEKNNSESNTIKALLHQVRLIIVPSAEPMSPLEHFDGTLYQYSPANERDLHHLHVSWNQTTMVCPT